MIKDLFSCVWNQTIKEYFEPFSTSVQGYPWLFKVLLGCSRSSLAVQGAPWLSKITYVKLLLLSVDLIIRFFLFSFSHSMNGCFYPLDIFVIFTVNLLLFRSNTSPTSSS